MRKLLVLAYVALVALFLLLGVKPYFLAPAYTMLLAAGAVRLEQANLCGAVPG